MTTFTTKDDLLAGLQDSNRRAAAWFREIPAGDFFKREAEAWSLSDNLDQHQFPLP
jgi:hypothetical protein